MPKISKSRTGGGSTGSSSAGSTTRSMAGKPSRHWKRAELAILAREMKKEDYLERLVEIHAAFFPERSFKAMQVKAWRIRTNYKKNARS